MKPIVIIAISVGCSVAAVLAVLIGIEAYSINEAQKALAIELERQSVCELLFDPNESVRQIELWGICINEGIDESVVAYSLDCGLSTSPNSELCRTDRTLWALQIAYTNIKLDREYLQQITSQKAELEKYRPSVLDRIQISNENNEREILDKKQTELDWMSKFMSVSWVSWTEIYEECKSTSIPYYDTKFLRENFCENTLKDAVEKSCTSSSSTCNRIFADIKAGIFDPNFQGWNTQADLFESFSKSCKANPNVRYVDCICGTELDSFEWNKICRE